MELSRKPFQGITNVIRFNWHLYLLSALLLLLLFVLALTQNKAIQLYIFALFVFITATTGISLITSFYIYDVSDLYKLPWLNDYATDEYVKNINVHAGFDETSTLLQDRYKEATLSVVDFYDPARHTEVSIKRARKAYPPHPDTTSVRTEYLPFANQSFDNAFVLFAAHEIRDAKERVAFFRELSRITQPDGHVFVTEHLRDFSNFFAYNIGFFHFHSRSTWTKTFSQAGWVIDQEIKTTPFITTFILRQNGNPL